jgi:arylsulfatase
LDPQLRASGEPKTRWTYCGNQVSLPEPIGPQLFPSAHSLNAELIIPAGGAEGVVTCAGAFSAGWSLYVLDGRPNFRYTFFELADVTIPGKLELPEGKVTLRTEFQPSGTPEFGGTLKLFVNDELAGEGELKRTAFRHGLEPFEVGRDSITPVSPAYRDRGSFPFTGQIKKVTFQLKR